MENETKIILNTPIKEIFTNHKTGEECFLVSSENHDNFTEADLLKITEICNQTLVYNFSFRDKLEGKPYKIDKAKEFIDWTIEGWNKQTWFSFLIRNSQSEIVGAIDIKSNNLESAEIGYWADSNHPGNMTNATQKLIEWAKKTGFKKLFATTKINNDRSQNVLIRNGFIRDGEIEKPDGLRFKFIKNLLK